MSQTPPLNIRRGNAIDCAFGHIRDDEAPKAAENAVYEYRTMPMERVTELTSAATPEEGSYLSDDGPARTYKKLLADGFRWVRTDMDVAVFERKAQK